MPESVLWLALGVALVLVPAGAFAALLRNARVFGKGGEVVCAVVGGVLCGVLVGPGVLGRAWPDTHYAIFVGGEHERETLQRLRREQAIELAVLRSSGATAEAVDEQQRLHEIDRVPAQRALDGALRDRRESWNSVALALAGACIALGLILRVARRGACPAREGRAAMLAGLAASVGVGVVGALALAVGTGASAMAALGFAVAVGSGWVLPSARARLLGYRGRRTSLDITCIAASGVGWLALGATVRSFWVAIAGVLTWMSWRQSGPRWGRRATRLMRFMLYAVAAPGISALAASRVDPYAVANLGVFWIAAGIAIVLSSDGRWTGVFAVWRALRPDQPWRVAAQRASAYTLSGAGLSQCIAALILLNTGVIREIDAAALVLAAATLECAAGLYRVISRSNGDDQRDGVASPVDMPGDGVSPN